MSASSRRIIHALFIGFGLFMIGGAGLLWVENRRTVHHADEVNDLRLNLNNRDRDVELLRRRLRACCSDTTLSAKGMRSASRRSIAPAA